MIDYIKRHERYVAELLETNPGPDALRELLTYHDKQISWMQQERLAHLITMMFVCLFFLLALSYTLMNPAIPCILLTVLLLALSAGYLLHYYRLENSVQRWYALSDRIRKSLLELR